MPESWSPYASFLCYFAKIWGLAVFSLEKNGVSYRSSFDKFLFITVFVKYLFTPVFIIFAKWHFTSEVQNNIVDSGFMASFAFGVVVNLITTMTFWHKSNTIVDVIRLFATIDKRLNYLGIEQNYAKQLKASAIFVGISFCVIFCSQIHALVASFSDDNQKETLLIKLLVSIYALIIWTLQHVVILYFTNVMTLAKKRYLQLNGLLSKVCALNVVSRGFQNSYEHPVNRNSFGITTELTEIYDEMFPANEKLKSFDKLIKIQDLHDKLDEATNKIIQLFSLPLTATIIFYTSETLANYFALYNFVTNGEWNGVQIHRAFCCSVALVLLKLELFAIARVCSSIQVTGNSMGTVLHKMWVRYHPIQLKYEIQMFSLQLLQRPLRISVFGFFPLDYSYLYKIFSGVMAYFVVIVQLDTSKARSIFNPNCAEWNGTDMNQTTDLIKHA